MIRKSTSESIAAKQPLTPLEVAANLRFTTLFRTIIDQRVAEKPVVPGKGQVWVDLLPRIPGWQATKWDDIENLVNQIHVLECTGWKSPDLNTSEIAVADLDPGQPGTYLHKQFEIGPHGVAVTIDRMYVELKPELPMLISSLSIEQAPIEMLDQVADEIGRIMTRAAL